MTGNHYVLEEGLPEEKTLVELEMPMKEIYEEEALEKETLDVEEETKAGEQKPV